MRTKHGYRCMKSLCMTLAVCVIGECERADAAFGFGTPGALNSYTTTSLAMDTQSYIANDSNGIWIVMWSSNDPLMDTIGTDFDVLFTRSADDGRTWSPPAPLNSNAAFDLGHDIDSWGDNGIGTLGLDSDGKGTWVAAWPSNDKSEANGGLYSIRTARSVDGGLSWREPVAIDLPSSPTVFNDTSASVAAGSDGTWIVAWTQWDAAQSPKTIAVQMARSIDSGDTWSAPMTLHVEERQGDSLFAWARIATDKAGNWLVAVSTHASKLTGFYNLETGTTLKILRSGDDGLTWSEPETLSDVRSIPPYYTTPSVPTLQAANGTWVICSNFGWQWLHVFSSRQVTPRSVKPPPESAAYRSVDAGLTWDTIPIDQRQSGVSLFPSLATDGGGNWVLVYTGWNLMTPGASSARLIRRSSDDGKSWSGLYPLNVLDAAEPLPEYCANQYEGEPRIACNGASGRWIVVWPGFLPKDGSADCDWDILHSISDNLDARAGDARVVSHTLPLVAAVGESFPVEITLQNTGDTMWTAAEFFGLAVTSDPCGLLQAPFSRLFMDAGAAVEPGGQFTFRTTFHVQTERAECEVRLRMLQEWTEFFGEELNASVTLFDTNRVTFWTEYE